MFFFFFFLRVSGLVSLQLQLCTAGVFKFFFTCFWRWRWYEDVPVFSLMALPFLAACQTENRHRSSRAIHLVWRVDVGESSIPVIAPCQKCEKLTGQPKTNFLSEVKKYEYHETRLTHVHPEDPQKTGKFQLVRCILASGGENSFLNWVQTLWQRNDLVCHQLLRESLIKVQFGCPIEARIRKISRTLDPLSRIFLQSWLI